MKKFNLIPAILLAVSPFFASAQQGATQTPLHSGNARGQISISGEKPLPATGSMYLDDRYMPAKISGNEQVILVKYNAYSDYFEMNNAGTAQTLPKQPGVTVTMTGTGDVYTLQNYKNEDGESVTGYLNVISDNPKVKIYKRESVYLQPGKISDNGYGTSKAPNYKRADDEFYMQINGGEIVFVSGKKDIANLVPGKSKDILDFIKKNKIDVEEAKDLQQLSGYLETIL